MQTIPDKLILKSEGVEERQRFFSNSTVNLPDIKKSQRERERDQHHLILPHIQVKLATYSIPFLHPNLPGYKCHSINYPLFFLCPLLVSSFFCTLLKLGANFSLIYCHLIGFHPLSEYPLKEIAMLGHGSTKKN